MEQTIGHDTFMIYVYWESFLGSLNFAKAQWKWDVLWIDGDVNCVTLANESAAMTTKVPRDGMWTRFQQQQRHFWQRRGRLITVNGKDELLANKQGLCNGFVHQQQPEGDYCDH